MPQDETSVLHLGKGCRIIIKDHYGETLATAENIAEE